MAVDGTWELTMQTPMGERQSTLVVKDAGGTLTGTQTAEGNSTDIEEGTVSGDNVGWKVAITNPMPLTLTFSGKVDGDQMTGDMDISGFGSWSYSGSRA